MSFSHEPLNSGCFQISLWFRFCFPHFAVFFQLIFIARALLMNDKPLRGPRDPWPDIMAYLMCEIKCCYIYRNYFIKIK